jgi:uncharacterized RDD family membrane protein YckC
MASTAPPPPVWQGNDSLPASTASAPAGFWIRVVAAFIDGLIIGVPVLVGIGTVMFGFAEMIETEIEAAILVTLLGLAGVVVGSWLYEAVLTSSSRQATVGKQIFGMRVLGEDGRPMGFGRATGRYFAKTIVTPLVPLGIGYLMAAFTARKRALHDMIASTVVVRNR